jgi:hypothetical protein
MFQGVAELGVFSDIGAIVTLMNVAYVATFFGALNEYENQ